jgi:hypothetical protein
VRLRGARRRRALRQVTAATIGLRWTRALLKLVLEELYVEEEIADFVGDVDHLSLERLPQVLAVAIALRHSWRSDDLGSMATRLAGIVRRPSECA